MPQLYANNAATTLAAPCSAVATEITVADGSTFPSLSGGDWFLLTIYQLIGTQETNYEILKVTARAGNVLTVVRAFEDAARFPARSYTVGDFAELRMTAASKGLAAQITCVPAGSIEATDVQAAIAELDAEKQPIDATLTAFAAVTVAADKLIYGDGADQFATTDLTAAGRALLDDADAAAQRATLGLDQVDNTPDVNKPVSAPQAAAIAAKADQATTYTKTETDTRIQDVVGAAPTALDTLAEIAAELQNAESAAGALVTTVAGKEASANKDASGGYAGLTGFALNLKNALGTIISQIASAATAARTWTFPDKSGTVAMTSDITGTNSGTNTGDETLATIKSKLGITTLSGSNTGDQTLGGLGAQAALVSGTNIKTVGGTSLLGSGDIAVLGTGANTFTGIQTFVGIKETKTAIAASDINLALGGFFTRTISGVTTLTVSNIPVTGLTASFILDVTNGGSAAITWWFGVKWAGGTAPTLTSAGRDVLGFFTHDGGTTWTGLVLAKDVK
jgi:hypothetical protein